MEQSRVGSRRDGLDEACGACQDLAGARAFEAGKEGGLELPDACRADPGLRGRVRAEGCAFVSQASQHPYRQIRVRRVASLQPEAGFGSSKMSVGASARSSASLSASGQSQTGTERRGFIDGAFWQEG
jgi:hypothetical protein